MAGHKKRLTGAPQSTPPQCKKCSSTPEHFCSDASDRLAFFRLLRFLSQKTEWCIVVLPEQSEMTLQKSRKKFKKIKLDYLIG